jgi:hypothetical protein
VTLATGKTYRFRVRAIDGDRNVSAFSVGPAVTPRLVQGSSPSVAYTRTWTTTRTTKASGGSVRYSKAKGATASLRATGRSFGLVVTKGPGRGKAAIYVNGVLKGTIDLWAPATTYRVQAWSISYSTSTARTVKVVVLGTSGRPRVDLDAFVVLK